MDCEKAHQKAEHTSYDGSFPTLQCSTDVEAANYTTRFFEVFADNQKLSAACIYPVGKKLQLDISSSNDFRIAYGWE